MNLNETALDRFQISSQDFFVVYNNFTIKHYGKYSSTPVGKFGRKFSKPPLTTKHGITTRDLRPGILYETKMLAMSTLKFRKFIAHSRD